ncbi:MAG: hypothetical protein ACR2Q4_05780 [Geminicoccaceae bacterium]
MDGFANMVLGEALTRVAPEPVLANRIRELNLALLCDYDQSVAGTIIDHVQGLIRYSAHNVVPINFRGRLPSRLALDRFDGVMLHYSLTACRDSDLAPAVRTALREFPGLKIAFVQDDYRFINSTVCALDDLGMHVLFGLAPDDIIDDIYAPSALPGMRRETLLAGYVPENLLHLDVPALRDRPIDIGYRARKLPAWLGSHGQEKWQIGAGVLEDADRYDLRCNISSEEGDRLYGERWIEFLTSCKAVLGTESGSSVCDFTGEIQAATEAHLVRDPSTSFEKLRDLYFKDADRRLMINVISPRCFEAAALRTLMILYEGKYSNRLEPWRHYVPLRKDHGNMEEVAAVLNDPVRAQAIVDRAYREVALNRDNGFEAMVSQVDRAIEATFQTKMRAVEPFYSKAELSRLDREMTRRARHRHRAQALHIGLHIAAVRALDRSLQLLPKVLRHWIRERFRRRFHDLKSMLRQMSASRVTEPPVTHRSAGLVEHDQLDLQRSSLMVASNDRSDR